MNDLMKVYRRYGAAGITWLVFWAGIRAIFLKRTPKMDPGWQAPIGPHMAGPLGGKPYRAVTLKDYKPLWRTVKGRNHSKEDTYPLT